MIIHYVCGSRADFGLMQQCLLALNAAPGLDLSIVVTGQATVAKYGDMAGEIAAAQLRIAHTIPITLTGTDSREMALAMAEELRGFTEYWSAERPDLVLLLGDRGEMLAAALAAFHLELPIAHLHGGERSGTLDEAFRHAISKLASYHLVASEDSRQRLTRMGEEPERIRIVGAPGLVEVANVPRRERRWFFDRFSLSPGPMAAVMLFHPVVQEQEDAYSQTRELVAALVDSDARAVVLRPNSDAGGAEIDRCLEELDDREKFCVLNHLPRAEFLQAVAAADVLVGNSSAGIIESASLGTPCLNLGSRQSARLRNDNTVDCPELTRAAIGEALASAIALQGPFTNLYGDGRTDRRLVEVIRAFPVGSRAPKKQNAY